MLRAQVLDVKERVLLDEKSGQMGSWQTRLKWHYKLFWGEKGKNGQYAFTEKVLRASHAQDARNSHALSTLTDDSLQTPAEREEERSESVLSEDSTRNSCATHAQVTRKPRARTLYINKTIQNKTKQTNTELPIGNSSVKLTDASSESVDFDQSLKNEREVSSEGKAEESQKSVSIVENSPSREKPVQSVSHQTRIASDNGHSQ